MSTLKEFLNKECPDGVEYVPLWSVTIWDKKFNSVDKDKQKTIIKYKYYLADELKQLVVENGNVKILTTNISNLFTLEKLVSNSLSYGEIVCIPWGGNPIVQYYKGKFITSDNRIATSIDVNKLDNKFLYYVLINKLDLISSFYRGAGIKHPDMSKVLDIIIPLPPIEVQKEIVRILDEFTEKTTKLQELLHKETVLRKKQYEYYRNYLFNKIQSYDNVFLGDIADISVGSKPEFIYDNKTEFEYINAGTTNSGYTNNYNCLGDTVTTPSRGQGGIGYIGYQKNNFWLGALCYQIRSNKDYILTKYIYYYLKNNNELILKIKNSGGLPSVNRNDLIKINIKFPNLEYQKEIINILDQFDTLCNDITKGLPAEIEMRKKQYEYYRDKLLTFKEKKK